MAQLISCGAILVESRLWNTGKLEKFGKKGQVEG